MKRRWSDIGDNEAEEYMTRRDGEEANVEVVETDESDREVTDEEEEMNMSDDEYDQEEDIHDGQEMFLMM